ncbi:MAG: MBOAT family protein, partial [Clostridia bacterium]|nr:MBOAT family protein [Clostridia bacterium]
MVFSSLFFLFAFLPANLLCYFCCKTVKTRNIILLLFSLVFYAFGEPVYIAILVLMSLFCWLFSRLIDTSHSDREKKLWLAAAVAVCIGAIGYFKYIGFAAESINGLIGADIIAVPQVQLPIGISFYTFQLLTYVIDVYRGEVPAQKSYWKVLLYASLFHQCIAGPIVRYGDIENELTERSTSLAEMSQGLTRFATGLAKKAILANGCGAVADTLLLTDAAIGNGALLSDNIAAITSRSALALWAGMAFYMLQIYLDFSSYSDMAIGMGLMCGFHYKENFN